jgi:hypothetical protein
MPPAIHPEENIYVGAYQGGIGQRAYGRSNIAARAINKDGAQYIEVSIGRATTYTGGRQVSAWVYLDPAKAHELACILNYLVHGQLTCKGEGPMIDLKHKSHADLNFHIGVDICTFLNDREGLKERTLKAAGEAFDRLTVPQGEAVVHTKP